MKSYIYIDNSNVFIEAQRVSAIKEGMAADLEDAISRRIFNFEYKLDYGKLYEYFCGGNKTEIGCAKLWGSPPPSDSFWKMVEKQGFQVVTYDRNSGGKEKKVDVAIAYAITKDAYTLIDKNNSEIVLVAGDKDYVPVIEDLKSEGFRVTVVFWEHAAKELKDSASKFISLNQWLDYMRLQS
ncbi:NYN domain-containing protein [Aeromonas veronii]|uniref:NYN domain-containing protein n=1 Tax=Aeromonas veronii TaxID=654 RepID=UPI0024164F3A|nr:NYN domain-containing protein [Aeromonas veronii]WFO49714.1 NYN domain-containing protein [Aeromonas veronii]